MNIAPDSSDHPIRRRPLKYVLLNSNDKQGRESYDTYFQLPISSVGHPEGFIVNVISVTMPNGVTPIHEFNSRLYFSLAGGPTLGAIVPSQSYTGVTFASAIETALNAAGGATFTVDYDDTTLHLILTCSTSFQFISPIVDTQGVNNVLDMLDEIGFNRHDLPIAFNQESTGPINLLGTSKVIISSSLGSQFYTSRGQRRILASVPMNSGFGSVIHWEAHVPAPIWVASSHIQDIAVQLWDDRGRLWKLPHNLHWQMVLSLERLPPVKVPRSLPHLEDGYTPPDRHKRIRTE